MRKNNIEKAFPNLPVQLLQSPVRLAFLFSQEGHKAEAIGVKLADFDGVQYSISNPTDKDGKEIKTRIIVSIALK